MIIHRYKVGDLWSWASCQCIHAAHGNLCKHQVKVLFWKGHSQNDVVAHFFNGEGWEEAHKCAGSAESLVPPPTLPCPAPPSREDLQHELKEKLDHMMKWAAESKASCDSGQADVSHLQGMLRAVDSFRASLGNGAPGSRKRSSGPFRDIYSTKRGGTQRGISAYEKAAQKKRKMGQ